VWRLARWCAAALAAAALAAGPAARAAAAPAPITVSAAASLKNALTAIRGKFERAHPDVAVALNFGASGTLELQILEGAPVDVFLSASPEEMNALAAKGMLRKGTRVALLRNELVLIVPRNSGGVTGFKDLTRPGVRVVAMGDPRGVPAGSYAKQVLQALGLYEAVRRKAVLGTDVRQVLADVETGSAEAGLVYATDAAISPRVRVVAEAPPGTHRPIVYPAAVLGSSAHPAAAQEFIGYLRSDTAREVFRRYGFRLIEK
jgi:molybdate transport system substrate-binding protein